MALKVKWIWAFVVVLSTSLGLGYAETYRLSAESGWQSTEDSPESQYLLEVSKIKQQLMTGSESDVIKALEQLEGDYPSLAGREIESYLKAEKLYSRAKWHKAAAEYKAFLDAWPDSILHPAALERIYSVGTAYLQGQKRIFLGFLPLPAFDTGAELMRDIADRAGNAPIALRALTTLAENQERKEQFLEAFDTWQWISGQWPTGQTRQMAVLRMAQALHASYDGAPYDATVLKKAETFFEDYQNNPHTDEAERVQINKTLALITEQLAYKEYETGLYYERTDHPDAAHHAYQKVLTQWPDSKAAQMAQARLAPDAVSPIKLTVRRRMVNGTTRFLDAWFGFKPLLASIDKQDPQE
ncbi:MAG: tetratricopeptide repeat protein [Planctomycetota bacterium]|jgi:outer membrane protein assembly factor BamD (BamD/ComL family)